MSRYKPTMDDVQDFSWNEPAERETGGKKYAGYQASIVGRQCEIVFQRALAVETRKIKEKHFRTPDFVNSKENVAFEVYCSLEIVVYSTNHMKYVEYSLEHAKDKMNKESREYLCSKYQLQEKFSYYAVCVMERPTYMFIGNWENLAQDLSAYDFDDFNINGLIIYANPSWHDGIIITQPGMYVYYQDYSKIDRHLFTPDTLFYPVRKP